MGFRNYDQSSAFLDRGARVSGCRNSGFDELRLENSRHQSCVVFKEDGSREIAKAFWVYRAREGF